MRPNCCLGLIEAHNVTLKQYLRTKTQKRNILKQVNFNPHQTLRDRTDPQIYFYLNSSRELKLFRTKMRFLNFLTSIFAGAWSWSHTLWNISHFSFRNNNTLHFLDRSNAARVETLSVTLYFSGYDSIKFWTWLSCLTWQTSSS